MERFWPPGAGPVVSESNREMLFMILQFLGEEKFKESVHKLEQESGLFFDIKYFEDQVEAGEWEEVDRYLSGFLKVNDNDESRTIFFEIRKQKYLESLDSQDRPKAIEILAKELRVCAPEENHFSEMTQLLSLDNFRQNEKLSNYGDVMSQRKALINILRRHIELNPLLSHKLKLPAFEASSLRKMIERHKIQHEPRKNSNPSPDMNTCCTNYTCPSNKGNDVPASNATLTKLIPRRNVSHPH